MVGVWLLENKSHKYKSCLGVLAAVIFLQLSQSTNNDEDNEADCFFLFMALVKQMSCFLFQEDESTSITPLTKQGEGEGAGMFDDDDIISPMDTMLHSM